MTAASTGEFGRATSVREVAEGRYAAEISPGWDIGGNANGGYLMAIAARAMADATGKPPLSLTTHFLAPGRPGPCTVEVEVVRAGRRTATASARLTGADGAPLLALLGTFAEQTPGGPTVVDAAPPPLPPPDQCLRVSPPVDGGGFRDRIDTLVRPGDSAFRDGRPSGRAEVAGWFRFVDGHAVDVFALMFATDAFIPVCFNRPEFPIGWAPTLELTVHVRGTPAPGLLRCRFESRFMQGGLFEEEGEVWDETGTLVAQSRQLALIPRGG